MDSSLEKNLLVTLLKFQIGLKEVVILFLIFFIKILPKVLSVRGLWKYKVQ